MRSSPTRLLVLFFIAVAACSTGPAAEPSPAPGPAGPSEPEKIVYEQVKWFEGLEEYVTIHKEFGATWCKRADGRIQDCEEVKREDREAYYRKWGAMTKDFAALLAATPDDQTLPASISFFVQEPPEMFSPDSAVKAAAQELFFENVLSEGKRWADWVVARGGTIKVPTTKSMPMFTMTATPPLYRIMAWTPGITGIRRSGGMKPGEFGFGGSGTTDGVDWIHSQVNNHDGLFGAGMKVGILGAGGGCGLDDEHEAFANAQIVEYATPESCTFLSGCSCDLGEGNGVCRAGRCLDRHESQVASVISVGRSGVEQYGASQATLYHYNGLGPNGAGACDATTTREAYEWFAATGVQVVNESFYCFHPLLTGSLEHAAQEDGFIQDYYARTYDIVVVRAAGNFAQEAAEANPPAFAPACPHTLNATCVGGIDHNGAVSCISHHQNPANVDREEPDVLSLAGASLSCSDTTDPIVGVDVALITPSGASTMWTKSMGGTSFAAPQVTQLATLFRERCGFGAPATRAFIRNAGRVWNPELTRYSTPGPGRDRRDGAGSPDAWGFPLDCGGGGDLMLDLTQTDPAPFEADCENCSEELARGGGLRFRNASQTRFGASGAHYKELAVLEPNATRVRVTFSWDACATASTMSAPAPVSTDFDLWLVDTQQARVIYGSLSNDDNNEGFDVDLTQFGTSLYAVWLSWPESAVPCDGAATEHAGFALHQEY